MFDPRRQSSCPAAWADHLRQQRLALAHQIHMFDITTVVVGDDCSCFERGPIQVSTAQEALDALPFPPLPAATVDFMSSCFFVNRLIPVADPHATGVTWPTIVIPSDDELAYFCDTEEDKERVLEILLSWRALVDDFASTHPCSPSGWIGAVRIPHPNNESGEDEMCTCWPWIHGPYGVQGRSGDSRLFDLFKVSVNRR